LTRADLTSQISKGLIVKNNIRFQFILIAALFLILHLSFARTDLYFRNQVPEVEKVSTARPTDDIIGNTVGKSTTFFLTKNEGADCGCTLIGNFVNPDKGFPPTVKADFASPKGKYKLSIVGSEPYTLYIKLVSNNTTVYQTTLPCGQW